ncbi:hypothetical protein D3C71_1376600 [compost metagenome]
MQLTKEGKALLDYIEKHPDFKIAILNEGMLTGVIPSKSSFNKGSKAIKTSYILMSAINWLHSRVGLKHGFDLSWSFFNTGGCMLFAKLLNIFIKDSKIVSDDTEGSTHVLLYVKDEGKCIDNQGYRTRSWRELTTPELYVFDATYIPQPTSLFSWCLYQNEMICRLSFCEFSFTNNQLYEDVNAIHFFLNRKSVFSSR